MLSDPLCDSYGVFLTGNLKQRALSHATLQSFTRAPLSTVCNTDVAATTPITAAVAATAVADAVSPAAAASDSTTSGSATSPAAPQGRPVSLRICTDTSGAAAAATAAAATAAAAEAYVDGDAAAAAAAKQISKQQRQQQHRQQRQQQQQQAQQQQAQQQQQPKQQQYQQQQQRYQQQQQQQQRSPHKRGLTGAAASALSSFLQHCSRLRPRGSASAAAAGTNSYPKSPFDTVSESGWASSSSSRAPFAGSARLFSRSSSNQYGAGASSGGHGHKRSLSSVSQVTASALERGRGECAVHISLL
jgi:hypothetical protein